MKRISTCFILLLFTLPTLAQLNAEQASIKKVFFDFLAFYKKNEAKFHSFKLYIGKGKDYNPPYHIQWKEAEDILLISARKSLMLVRHILKQSGFISNSLTAVLSNTLKKNYQWVLIMTAGLADRNLLNTLINGTPLRKINTWLP